MSAPGSDPGSAVSVVLCTRNRAPKVRACLAQFDGPEYDRDGLEWVLVDSASDDDTPYVFETWRSAHADRAVRVVRVERPGLSLARNAGVAASSGPIVVYLDDDVLLGPAYLERVQSHLSGDERVGIVSGRILRHDPQASLYGCQLSDRPRRFGPRSVLRPGLIQGANLAARRRVFDDVAGFDPELGAGARYRCEDVDFVARALHRGWHAVYDPEVVVWHDHGRHEGEAIDRLREENAFAAGAYVAKMIGLGAHRYWGLLATLVVAAPWRKNLRLRPMLAGFRSYRTSRGEGGGRAVDTKDREGRTP